MSFWYLHFSQKTNKKVQLYYYNTSSLIVFIRFLGELKTPKRHFEINWTLVSVCPDFFICQFFDHLSMDQFQICMWVISHNKEFHFLSVKPKYVNCSLKHVVLKFTAIFASNTKGLVPDKTIVHKFEWLKKTTFFQLIFIQNYALLFLSWTAFSFSLENISLYCDKSAAQCFGTQIMVMPGAFHLLLLSQNHRYVGT